MRISQLRRLEWSSKCIEHVMQKAVYLHKLELSVIFVMEWCVRITMKDVPAVKALSVQTVTNINAETAKKDCVKTVQSSVLSANSTVVRLILMVCVNSVAGCPARIVKKSVSEMTVEEKAAVIA